MIAVLAVSFVVFGVVVIVGMAILLTGNYGEN